MCTVKNNRKIYGEITVSWVADISPSNLQNTLKLTVISRFYGYFNVKFTENLKLRLNSVEVYGKIPVNVTVKYLAAGLPTIYRKIYGIP